MNKEQVAEVAQHILTFLAGVAPGAIGAGINVILAGTLTWTQRFLQFSVGIVASYYAGLVARDVTDWSPFVIDGIAFTAGMVAFESFRKLRQSVPETVGRIPSDLWEIIKAKLGGTRGSGE